MQFVPDSLVQRARRLQPDVDEVVIRQQVITILPTIFAITAAIALAAPFFVASLPTIGLALLAIAVAQGLAFTIGIARPEHIDLILMGFATVAVCGNFYIHAAAGGYSSGMWSLAWLALLPLALFFVASRRIGIIALALVLATYIVAALFDQRFAASPLAIPNGLKVYYDLVTLFSVTLVGFAWAVFLVGQLGAARQQADALLLNVLPRPIADRLKQGEANIADSYAAVTILFADIVDFTTMSAAADPETVVSKLNDLFSAFDDLAARHGLEKIKTIGDAYMVAGGLPEPRPDHAEAVAAFAIDMLGVIDRHESWTGEPFRVRVGINTGPIVAGVIGRQKFIYDMWGDAVNVASRMESNGLANQIQVTAAVKEELNGQYEFEERPPIQIKGKGLMVTYIMRPLA